MAVAEPAPAAVKGMQARNLPVRPGEYLGVSTTERADVAPTAGPMAMRGCEDAHPALLASQKRKPGGRHGRAQCIRTGFLAVRRARVQDLFACNKALSTRQA